MKSAVVHKFIFKRDFVEGWACTDGYSFDPEVPSTRFWAKTTCPKCLRKRKAIDAMLGKKTAAR